MSDLQTKKIEKWRNYASIVYEESAPPDWACRLADMHLKTFISPYHDKDTKDNGELKKPHWHIMLMYDSPVPLYQAKADFVRIGALEQCEILKSKQGYARYLCHLDDKDKYQYNVSDVVSLGGANYIDTIMLETDKVNTIKEILEFIDDNQIINYSDFIRYCMADKIEWLSFVSRNQAVITTIKEFQKSVFWGIKNDKRQTNKHL